MDIRELTFSAILSEALRRIPIGEYSYSTIGAAVALALSTSDAAHHGEFGVLVSDSPIVPQSSEAAVLPVFVDPLGELAGSRGEKD